MRRISKLTGFLLLLFIMLVSLPLPVDAAAYKTYSKAPSGELVETQTAYEAYDILFSNQMKAPEDIVIKEDKLYLVDSQEKKVMIMNKQGELIDSFGEDILSGPTGIDLDKDR